MYRHRSPETNFDYQKKNLEIAPHIENIMSKCKLVFDKLMKTTDVNWGIKYEALGILYTGIVLAILSYGVYTWFDKFKSRDLKNLVTCQRYALLRFTLSYKTVSHEALQAIAGAIPIDLVIRERRLHYKIRENITSTFLGLDSGVDKAEAKSRFYEAIWDKWQRRWDTSTKDRITHTYLPDVRRRLRGNADRCSCGLKHQGKAF